MSSMTRRYWLSIILWDREQVHCTKKAALAHCSNACVWKLLESLFVVTIYCKIHRFCSLYHFQANGWPIRTICVYNGDVSGYKNYFLYGPGYDQIKLHSGANHNLIFVAESAVKQILLHLVSLKYLQVKILYISSFLKCRPITMTVF